MTEPLRLRDPDCCDSWWRGFLGIVWFTMRCRRRRGHSPLLAHRSTSRHTWRDA